MAACTGTLLAQGRRAGGKRPNVVLILTDDQGYGDVGWHGNDKVRTPHTDRLAAESTEFEQFYVCPVCTPTRATMMTGRYNYRTRAIDTYLGRAMMDPEEVTVAEMLAGGGYRTGIFGKWHLGDNYPMRACDQGFHESLVHKGGGLCQPANPPEGNSYFDPTLFRNGKPVKTKGYCTDIFTDAALKFIEDNRDRPFFLYLPTNAPHTPLHVDEKYAKPYKAMGLDDTTAKLYAMLTNLDDNIGRLLAKLKELKLEEDTIVFFITDNGPQQARYNAGLRGRKGSVWEGGIRVPMIVRWPGRFAPGKKINRIAGHIDILPTLLDICGVSKPAGLKLDGRSLMPLLTQDAPDWPDRTMFFQWHRGDVPDMGRACAARNQRWKLVQAQGVNRKPPANAAWELFDIENDPLEKNNVAAQHPGIAAKLRKEYEAWFRDVSGTRGYAPPRIHIGTPHENPVMLSRQDWRGPKAGWGGTSLGHWEVHVAKEGTYSITLRCQAFNAPATAFFRFGDVTRDVKLEPGAKTCTFKDVPLKAGDGKLEAWVLIKKKSIGVQYVFVEG